MPGDVLPASALAPGVRRREVWAWAMYDFANSSYTTVVVTALFNAYFVSVVCGNASWATLAWTSALALSSMLIMATAPLIGAYADAHAAKKRLLFIATAGCVGATASLAVVGPGDVALAFALVALSSFFFGSGENLIAAFLPELATPQGVGRVSGWGWSLGYIGGLVSLAVCIAYVARQQGQGLPATDAVPVCMLATAGIYLLAAMPTFLWLRERAIPTGGGHGPLVGSVRLRDTLRTARRYRDMHRFLLCIVFYQAGIQAVVALAAVYAQQAMGFGVDESLQLVFVVNVTAAIGAFAFGHLQDRIGHVRSLALTLCGWIAMTLLAWAAEGPSLFWLAANIAGLCMGSSQAGGRALVGVLAPLSRRAEFFGLWGLAVKLSGIVGPLSYGLTTWLSGGDHRRAILLTGSYFVVGLVLLFGVDVGRGQLAARQGDDA